MAATRSFLVEIGTEELPPKALLPLSDAFREHVAEGLAEAGLDFGRAEAFATPRRLAVRVQDLAMSQADREVEMRGPPERVAFDDKGQPTRAALAFAKKCGVEVGALDRLETDKGTWLVHQAVETGQPAAVLLPGIVSAALKALPIPRPMRWGAHETEFVRPVHWVVMLLDDEVVDTSLFGIAAGRDTGGHRFHAPGPIALSSAGEYETTLQREGQVIASFGERRRRVAAMVDAAARALDGEPVGDDALLDEVTALVEWPVPVSARFSADFLELPDEVLIETLQAHQRYFPVRGADGRLLPNFITVSNIDSADPDQVRDGNERVVTPRLADAAFFYDADRRVALADRVSALGGVVFQKKLGTLADKTARVMNVAAWLADQTGNDKALATRAAQLSKCDLLTDMVGEFPSLQGTMGRYYARHDGEPDAVADAIGQQYRPRFAGDGLPDTAIGQVLSIADRIDTIVGIFAIGRRPSGTRDPFGLRRSALGILRILIEYEIDVDLLALIRAAAEQQPVDCESGDFVDDVYQYFVDRLRGHYVDGDGDITPQVFDAVAARRPERPVDFHARVLAVKDFASLDAADALAAANKRIANILRSAKDEIPDNPDPKAFSESAELELDERVRQVADEAQPLIDQRRYGDALTHLASLRPSVDRFFDDVMVMCEDEALRRNRLALLGRLRRLFLRIADVSRLQVG